MYFSTTLKTLSIGLILLLEPATVAAGRRGSKGILKKVAKGLGPAADVFSIGSDIHSMTQNPQGSIAGRIKLRDKDVQVPDEKLFRPYHLCHLLPRFCPPAVDQPMDIVERDLELDRSMLMDANDNTPPGVPQYNYDMCVNDMISAAKRGVKVLVKGPINGNGIHVSRVPPTCMVLANFFVGDGTDGPTPIPMGSDSLQYNNLTPAQYNGLKAVFEEFKVK